MLTSIDFLNYFSSVVYVETDASLRNFEDVSDGKLQQRLNLIQSEFLCLLRRRKDI